MQKIILLLLCVFLFRAVPAQKIETIAFNLYTDSLKKGFYNYINIDGKYSDGRWLPLGTDEVDLMVQTNKANEKAVFFNGNSLFIDSAYTADTIKIRAVLKSNPAIWQEVTIYIRKRGFDEPLKSDEDILNEMRTTKKPKQYTA